MNKDLISRSELKKAIEPYRYATDGVFEGISLIIDNAPTVEPFEPDYVGAERLKARQRGYEEGYHNGMKIGKTLNPKIKQGEWKLIRVADHCGIHDSFVCPFCNYEREYRKKNFCEECGADLRGDNHDG